MKRIKILGVSSSLRCARFGRGSDLLCDEIRGIQSREELSQFLIGQTKIRFKDFLDQGRKQDLPFDEIYDRLQKLKGDQGLSNSEAALVAGLWGAHQEGADIDHVSLASFFGHRDGIKNEEALRKKILECDGIILSGPVYFGDRGSLSQSFIEMLDSDPELNKHIKDKIYVGLSVGAKRNGGQETTLIYQMLDMVNMGMLGVGNDSETTSQYGGTGVAGDVGTFGTDDYGIDTCVGSGRRIGRVARLMESGASPLSRPINVDVWVLQDSTTKKGLAYFESWRETMIKSVGHGKVNINVRDFTEENIMRCIACDNCPEEMGRFDEYRCIIKSSKDFFKVNHLKVVSPDAILFGAYSPKDRKIINSVYQKFIERTRYLRRDNYALGDRLISPFVISEVSSRQNLHMRMLTSAVRHHTVVHHPLIGVEYEGKLINSPDLERNGISFIKNARKLLEGRVREGGKDDVIYYPLGYKISSEKVKEDIKKGKTKENINSRLKNDLKINS